MADPYLTPADLRAWYPALAADQTDITDAKLEAFVASFEDIAERYRGVAYTPREATETVDVCGTTVLLSNFLITDVETLDIDEDPVTGYTFTSGYSVVLPYRHSGTMVITYTHGFATPPPTVLDACREYVKSRALQDRSSISRDAVSTTDGGYTIKYSTPSWKDGRPTGFLEVDASLNSLEDYRKPVVV